MIVSKKSSSILWVFSRYYHEKASYHINVPSHVYTPPIFWNIYKAVVRNLSHIILYYNTYTYLIKIIIETKILPSDL